MISMEREFVLFKPDAIQRGLIGELLSRLENKGLRLAAMKFMLVDEDLANKHYEVHKERTFFKALIQYITSGPVVALALEGKNAVSVTRAIVGATNPVDALPGTIRGDLAMDIGRNLIHASDSVENAEYELGLYFTAEDYVDWQPIKETWLYE